MGDEAKLLRLLQDALGQAERNLGGSDYIRKQSSLMPTPMLGRKTMTAKEDTFFGCTTLFGICGPDDIINLSILESKFSEWLGWRENNLCEQFIKMVNYMDVEGTAAGTAAAGDSAVSDPCSPPKSSEWGRCEILLGPKGTLSLCGEPINLLEQGERKCDKVPIYTIPTRDHPGGIRITNDLDWEAVTAMEAVKADLERLIITGSQFVPGEFDGLERLVNTGYADVHTGISCSSVDSTIVDWASDDMTGAVNNYGSIVNKITEIVRRIKQRVNYARLGNIRPGDMVIVLPSFLADCLLDEWACWGLCAGQQYNEVFRNSLDLRTYREGLNGGLFGDGQIEVDGFPIPLIRHDWMTIGQAAPNFCSDIYILTRQIGARRILYGQYMNLTTAGALAQQFGATHYRVIGDGKFIQLAKNENWCVQTCVALRPNIYLSAPWAQARITDVCCYSQLGPITPDAQSSYYIEQGLEKAAAIPQEYAYFI